MTLQKQIETILLIMKQPVESVEIYYVNGTDDGRSRFNVHLWCNALSDELDEIWDTCSICVDVDDLAQPTIVDVAIGWDYYRDAPKWESQRRSEIEVWREAMTPTEQVEAVFAHLKKCIQRGQMDKVLLNY